MSKLLLLDDQLGAMTGENFEPLFDLGFKKSWSSKRMGSQRVVRNYMKLWHYEDTGTISMTILMMWFKKSYAIWVSSCRGGPWLLEKSMGMTGKKTA